MNFSVNVWGSKPGTNDDCWYGSDHETLEAAVAAFEGDQIYVGHLDTTSPWIELDGPGVHRERRNPHCVPRRSLFDDDAEWQREIEREHLMLHGSLDA